MGMMTTEAWKEMILLSVPGWHQGYLPPYPSLGTPLFDGMLQHFAVGSICVF